MAILRRRPELVLSPLLFVTVLILWEIVVEMMDIGDYILPRPSVLGPELLDQIQSAETWVHVRVTVTEVVLGFAIATAAALIVGMCIALLPALQQYIMPYLVAAQAIPIVALAPMFVLWFGFGQMSKIALSAFTAWFPILIGVVNGFGLRDESKLGMIAAFTGNRWHAFRMVRLPNAIPFIFAGMNVGIVFALLGAVVGEFVGATNGLGYAILQSSFAFDIPAMFTYIIALSVMGVAFHAIIVSLHRVAVYWEPVSHGD